MRRCGAERSRVSTIQWAAISLKCSGICHGMCLVISKHGIAILTNYYQL